MFDLNTLRTRCAALLAPGEVDILLAHCIKKDKTFLFAHEDYRLSPIAYLQFRYFVWKRRRGIPIAYITHHKEFYGIDVSVNKHTLIPRPDTELMVEVAIQEIKKARNQQINLIDVGTGSGCIPIAIAMEFKKQTLSHELKMYATDISEQALKVAKKNARTQNVSIEFLHGNLLEPLQKSKEKRIKNKDSHDTTKSSLLFTPYSFIITANLPYLTQIQFDSEPSIQHEPHSALVASNQGLALYKQLLAQVASQLLFTPHSLLLLFEIDPSQSTLITPLVHRYLPTATVTIKTDLAGHDRLVHIWLDNSQKMA